MSECYVEILQESRNITVGETDMSQTIVIQFQLDDQATSANPLLSTFLGEDDDTAALEQAYTLLPRGRFLPAPNGGYNFLILTSLQLDQVNNYGWWKATAEYKFDENTGTGGNRPEDPTQATLPFIKIGFSIGNRTKTITQSKEVLSRDTQIGPAARPNPCNDTNGNSIGVSADGVSGAEVYSAGLTLQITAYYFPEFISFEFIRLLRDMCPSVNSDQFLTFEPGEVLLYGADGSGSVNDIVPITFTVEVKKNLVNEPDPPFPPLTCTGHSIIDYRYVKELDECAQTLLQLPSHRIVHRGYDERRFADLGFPTS
jgi:hypothetical protein